MLTVVPTAGISHRDFVSTDQGEAETRAGASGPIPKVVSSNVREIA
jgi:hypothetical protein